MAVTREIKSAEVKIHEIVNRPHEDSENDTPTVMELDISVCSFPALVSKETLSLLSPLTCGVHGTKPRELIVGTSDKPQSCSGTVKSNSTKKASKPKWTPFVSTLSVHEQKMFIFKPYRQKKDPSNQRPKNNSSSIAKQMNQKKEASNSNLRTIALLYTPNKPRSDNDSFKLNPEAAEFKPRQNDNNTYVTSSKPRKMPLLPNSLNSGATENQSALILGASENASLETAVPEINSGKVDTASDFDLQTDQSDPSTGKEKPKGRLFSTVLQSAEYTNNEIHVPPTKFVKTDPAQESSKGRANSSDLNCCTNLSESEWVYFPATLSLSTYEKQKSAAPIIDSGKMDALCDFKLPKGLGDSVKLKSRPGQLKPKLGHFTAVLSEHEPTDKKIVVFKENSETFDTGCNVNLPKNFADSLKLKSCTHLSCLKQNTSDAASCSETATTGQSTLSEQDRHAVFTADRLVVHIIPSAQVSAKSSEMKVQSGNVNTELTAEEASLLLEFPNCPERKQAVLSESEPTDKKIAVFKAHSETINAACDVNLPKTYADSLKLKSCAHLNGLKQNTSNVVSYPETATNRQSTLSEQNRQADRLVVYGNPTAPVSVRSSEVKVQSGNVNTDLTAKEASLLLEFPNSPERRLARYFRRNTLKLCIADTYTHHGNAVNSDTSFHHGGDLPQNSNCIFLLPEKLPELDSDEGPVTPELYNSRDDIFLWDWPQFPIFTSEILDIDDTWGQWYDPLPKLEMTASHFEEMVITGTGDFVDEELNVTNRMHTDDLWMSDDDGSDSTSQLSDPAAASEFDQPVGECLHA